jgi:predicted acylesterase/phospholipase RssA
MAGEPRDVAVVLSGGGVNGLLLEIGFLKRLRESELWNRITCFFGASAGALNGCMAALDRLDDLERFVLGLRPEETFRANRLWRLPLLGTHDYVLPRTIAARLGDPVELAIRLREAPAEVVVVVTDVTRWDDDAGHGRRLFERAYSSRHAAPEEMAQAVLASAAISSLVLPVVVGDRIATDGGWVRNFPLGYAYERPEVQLIVAFRYEGRYPIIGLGPLRDLARKLRRYARLPAARALLRELEEATEREERGQPAHIVDTFSRLSRVTMIRNTELEELVAQWRERSVSELRALRADVRELASADPELAERIDRRFAEASFPFEHDRVVPRITVAGGAGGVSLDPGFRNPRPWREEAKRELIETGYELTEKALLANTFLTSRSTETHSGGRY